MDPLAQARPSWGVIYQCQSAPSLLFPLGSEKRMAKPNGARMMPEGNSLVSRETDQRVGGGGVAACLRD